MSKSASTSSVKNRPSPLSSKSFARYEPAPISPTGGRNRASTVDSPVAAKSPKKTSAREDVFDKKLNEEGDEDASSPATDRTNSLPDKFDELPVELASSIERFVESLGAKVFSEPPTIDQLSDIFQEFYIQASAKISIHISALISKINREPSPAAPNANSRTRSVSKKQSSDSLAPPDRLASSQQMLTASEVTEKRKARKLLEYKRVLLEEAVERRICEKVYTKIWRHKSTMDEARDEKLRSKTAALALVGIGLKDLGVEVDERSTKTLEDVQESLTPVREGLERMNEAHYPLGKLQHLTTAHKAIVDTLYSIHPSSASADDILPTLIYSLITSPVEGINIISNLNFIQRFRTATKIDGEAAYCMTNLEAAIGFLENVDLASLRADELPEGPKKSTPSPLQTPGSEKAEPFPSFDSQRPSGLGVTASTTMAVTNGVTVDAPSTPSTPSTAKPSLEKLSTARHHRTISDLLQPISQAPANVRSSAEESLKTVSSTLDSSFKFLFGKLRERTEDPTSPNTEVILPKTLDEARQLVSRPLTPPENDDGSAISETSSITGDTHTPPSRLSTTEDKILSLLGGRRRTNSLMRDRSVDSNKSNNSNTSSSNKRIAFAASGSAPELPTLANTQSQPQSQKDKLSTPTASTPLDSVKSFGSSINPISHLNSAFSGGLGAFSRLSRQVTPPAPSRPSPTMSKSPSIHPPNAELPVDGAAEISLRPPSVPETAAIKSQPPNQRFVGLENPEDLKVSEIPELLRDYQRLARLIQNLKIIGEEEGSAA